MLPWMTLSLVLLVTRFLFLSVEGPAFGLRGMTWSGERMKGGTARRASVAGVYDDHTNKKRFTRVRRRRRNAR